MQPNSPSGEPITEINITPLVDVSLVLVIIFMITMPFLVEKSMRVTASSQKVVDVSSAEEPVLVELTSAGLSVDGKSVEFDALAGVLKKNMEDRGVSAVSVSVEKTVRHGRVVAVLDEVMAAGAKQLNLIDPEEGNSVSL